ncbi:MAG: hypothetical protein PF545_02680 [Elusimicrobia bacterium]|jgi:tetratricopeptide (TPR) repeat protein|nr:hypothetical protein [Elusimicrobiota bacterium]
MQQAFLSLDISDSTLLKHGAESQDITESFNNFHSYVKKHISDNNGFIVSVSGDGIMAQFSEPDQAVGCAFGVPGGVTNFNREKNTLDFPFRLRIGISCAELNKNRALTGNDAHPALDAAGKLQKNGIPGNVMISSDVYNELTKYSDFFSYFKSLEVIKTEVYVNVPMPHWTPDIMGEISSIHYNGGYRYLNEEKYPEAEKKFRKALTEAEKGNNLRLISSCLHGLGYALGRQRKNKEKIPFSLKQIKVSKKIGDQKSLITAYRNIYYAYQWEARNMDREQKFDWAIGYYEKALEAAAHTGESLLKKRAYVNLTDLKLYLKNKNKK